MTRADRAAPFDPHELERITRDGEDAEAEDAYNNRLETEGRARRAELWRRTPEGHCEDCLKPIPPSWNHCNDCEDRWDYERRENER